ncbi:MAG: ribonuclease P protein component [Oscillospiraceae bacterium]
MTFTVSLKKNRDFRRLYSGGRTKSGPYLVVYCRKNGTSGNRLGITVSTKLGSAVRRNRIRRRIKEAYRLGERDYLPGFDIVIVGRARALGCDFSRLCESLYSIFEALGIKDEKTAHKDN